MFEAVLPVNAFELIRERGPRLKDFHLAGGTGLALQLGHRRSADLDFFTPHQFNADSLLEAIHPDRVDAVEAGTVHCEIDTVKLTFLFCGQPTIFPLVPWNGIRIADWRDITAEKFKTIAQGGSKRDFFDLYAVIQTKFTVAAACGCFKDRFAATGINMYHVLKSLVYFDEAEGEPEPVLAETAGPWKWGEIKRFFAENIRTFEQHLLH